MNTHHHTSVPKDRMSRTFSSVTLITTEEKKMVKLLHCNVFLEKNMKHYFAKKTVGKEGEKRDNEPW